MDSRNRKLIPSLLSPLIPMVVLLSACGAQGHEAQDAPPPPAVDVAEVAAEPVVVWESFTGRVAAAETVELRPRVSGYIQKVAFEEGELVKAGALLFQIDPRPYQARVNAARAELAQARSQFELASSEAKRTQSLLKSRAVSRELYDQRQAAVAGARAHVDAAKAELDAAELDLEYTRVTAPISGRAGRALVTRGNLASADQTLLTTVVSVDPVHVYFEADERTAFGSPTFSANGRFQNVRVELGGSHSADHTATLDFIDNRLNAGTGTLQYRAVLPNPDGRIKPGQFARVEMPVAQLNNALLVDRKAVLTDQDRRFVYVVDDSNRTDRRQVTTGRQVDELVVIRGGLRNGDRVIVNGVQKVMGAGTEVIPQRVAMGKSSRAATAVAAAAP
ncbi:efflux RND transporter periplasmic adaptor subunit [Gilvimarinus sp. F26214L]|uniref:efflux RND transporter periplasmic adaptor subunit n=1 Tax=Gilvimarinus sp. DZF01 TaxID=3461371 RepID=UPI00404557CA